MSNETLRLFSGFLLLLTGSLAFAEYPVLTATSAYARAEVRAGPYGTGSPENLVLIHNGSAAAGQQWRADEGQRICGRRSGNPSDPASPLGPWYCISSYADISPGQPTYGNF